MSYPHLSTDCHEYHDVVVDYGAGPRPEIVVLCGSTRFVDTFQRENLRLTLAGAIVLSIGCDTKSDADLATAGQLGTDPDQLKTRLDELHKRKIDLADRVLVLNIGGHVGDSTRSEIEYAQKLDKPVDFLEPYVAGECGHRIAGSEHRAGYRTCERCPAERGASDG